MRVHSLEGSLLRFFQANGSLRTVDTNNLLHCDTKRLKKRKVVAAEPDPG